MIKRKTKVGEPRIASTSKNQMKLVNEKIMFMKEENETEELDFLLRRSTSSLGNIERRKIKFEGKKSSSALEENNKIIIQFIRILVPYCKNNWKRLVVPKRFP